MIIVIVAAAACVLLMGDDDDDDSSTSSSSSSTEQDASENLAALDELLAEMSDETADYPTRLMILGNANLDDVLDTEDLEVILDYIGSGYNYVDAYFADANYDGLINEDDYEIVEQMIEYTQDVVYYLNVDYQIASYNTSYPLHTANILTQTLECLILLAPSSVVATDQRCEYESSMGSFYTEYEYILDYDNLGSIGSHKTPNIEDYAEVAQTYGDGYLTVWMNSSAAYGTDYLEAQADEYEGIQLLRLPSWENGSCTNGLLTAGYLFYRATADSADGDSWTNAVEYVAYYDEQMDTIDEKIATLDDDDKQKVVVTWVNSWTGSTETEYSLLYKGSGEYYSLLRMGVEDVTAEWMEYTGQSNYYITMTQEDMAELYQQFGIDLIIGTIAAPYNATADDMIDSYTYRGDQVSALDGTDIIITGWIYGSGPAEFIFCYLIGYYMYPDLFSLDEVEEVVNGFLQIFGTYGTDETGQWTFDTLNLLYCGEDSPYNIMA